MTGNGCSALWMRLDVPFLFPFMENMTAANIFKRAQARAETATLLSKKCTKLKSPFKKQKTKDRAGARREAPALRRIIALIAQQWTRRPPMASRGGPSHCDTASFQRGGRRTKCRTMRSDARNGAKAADRSARLDAVIKVLHG